MSTTPVPENWSYCSETRQYALRHDSTGQILALVSGDGRFRDKYRIGVAATRENPLSIVATRYVDRNPRPYNIAKKRLYQLAKQRPAGDYPVADD